MPKSSFQALKYSRKRQFHRIRQEALQSRPVIGAHSSRVLRKTLAMADRHDLIGRTLLDSDVHKQHSALMLARFEKLVERCKVDYDKMAIVLREHKQRVPSFEAYLRTRLRFLTVLHSCQYLNVRDVKKSAVSLASKLSSNLNGVRQRPKLVGAIEIEVVSMKLMRGQKFESGEGVKSGRRKLEVLESMCKGLLSAEETIALVHFHGVIDIGKNSSEERVGLIRDTLQTVWKGSYRVEMKGLSEEFGGKQKSVNANLKHIARYITKGGNLMVDGKTHMRYKVAFDQDDLGYEAMMITEGWRKKGSIIQIESKTEGFEDVLSLTGKETLFHAEAIDVLMGDKRNRQGYVLVV
jgi:hypothetical protein